MKLLRYGPIGQEKPAALDADGQLRDLSMLLPDITGKQLDPVTLNALDAIDLSRLPAVDQNVRIGCPVAGVGKIICVGLNYADHARESGLEPPPEPVLFMKPACSIVGPNDNVIIPRGSVKTDWEVELGVVIGTAASYVDEADALNYVAGYVVINDVSEREFQLERAGQWDKGKGCDTFSPIGPWLVTRDAVADPHQLNLWLEVNGRRVQDSSTAQFIFGIPKLVSYISQFMTLYPGDIISTGTPPGVGLGQKPAPWYLRPGDTMRLGIAGLGEQQQTLAAWTR
ncbi:2-keto-4-pentenoate hydratase/2-oxohepta-3-ene-1,7-dioic acid hydratase in catechol pathway [Silvimonas terrae]|uniref:2-keto-4-pentenoate hydratase/2-oxohepta-3-ene-1,7-dioic acid hydratase in catechol pathway n=1 Tax=Silvimonas terrae TaxID=300266 RepID=A0A840RBK9_9NEIS|nr:fumarylacetoacetate hydrolase family protein [Silvimonas terrae]MBB5189793.1 2-keto-4-pentenoate hydratase/2-oxohepta-3-ene-1,7-dioic acid hydratase in catechol pathway [Silvimonas terrae]